MIQWLRATRRIKALVSRNTCPDLQTGGRYVLPTMLTNSMEASRAPRPKHCMVVQTLFEPGRSQMKISWTWRLQPTLSHESELEFHRNSKSSPNEIETLWAAFRRLQHTVEGLEEYIRLDHTP